MKISDYIDRIETAKAIKTYLLMAVDEPDNEGFVRIPKETASDMLDVIDDHISFIHNMEVN